MKAIICDICDQPINSRQYKVIIKKEWFSFAEHGFEKMDICEYCANRIIEYIEEKESERESENECK